MALVTLCPGCGTTFRVSSPQLQAHSGDVCCGQCGKIFNGFATLTTVNESELESLPSVLRNNTAVSNPVPHLESTIADSGTSGTHDEIDRSFTSDWDQEENQSSDDDEYADPDTGFPPIPPYIWNIASFFLFILLAGQATYAYRTELSAMMPQVRPYLERYCAIVSCTVPYPKDINLLGIESSDLQVHPERHPKVTTLVATIRNHAPFPQALPALKLSLLDVHNELLASRVFAAEEYLAEHDDAASFIQPHGEIDIEFDFDSDQLNAMGYRLLLLHH